MGDSREPPGKFQKLWAAGFYENKPGR